MLNYITSILPIVLYLIILKCLDNFRIVRLRTIFVCLIMGITSCIIAALITSAVHLGQWGCILEEIIKASFAVILVSRKKIVFFVEALVYGATIGSGFALAENIIYLHFNPDMLIGTAIFRGLSTALLHMGCTALMSVILLRIAHSQFSIFHSPFSILSNSPFSIFHSPFSILNSPFSILPVILIHYCYNLMLLAPLIQMVVTIITFLFIFIFISNYNERKIYQWLDHSITFDIQLLAAIREGHLADTKSGQYLQTIKDQFDPEVFFDVVCFMELYLEMTIEGKSRLLLKEEGLAMPLTPEQTTLHNEKLTELLQLRRNIGHLGEYLLRPIITINDQDLRMM